MSFIRDVKEEDPVAYAVLKQSATNAYQMGAPKKVFKKAVCKALIKEGTDSGRSREEIADNIKAAKSSIDYIWIHIEREHGEGELEA